MKLGKAPSSSFQPQFVPFLSPCTEHHPPYPLVSLWVCPSPTLLRSHESSQVARTPAYVLFIFTPAWAAAHNASAWLGEGYLIHSPQEGHLLDSHSGVSLPPAVTPPQGGRRWPGWLMSLAKGSECPQLSIPSSTLPLRKQPLILNLYSRWILFSSWPSRKFIQAGSFQQRRLPLWGRDVSLNQGCVNKPTGQINSCPLTEHFVSKKGDIFISICLPLTSIFNSFQLRQVGGML